MSEQDDGWAAPAMPSLSEQQATYDAEVNAGDRPMEGPGYTEPPLDYEPDPQTIREMEVARLEYMLNPDPRDAEIEAEEEAEPW